MVKDLTILGCSSQQPTRRRNQSGYLVRWNNQGLLFDPGEGTQRQFIFANIAPTCINRIFISHFHGDHCLGLGSMLMRLNLDKITHPVHCYYPASGKKYFDRLRYGCIYHEKIEVIEHPVKEDGLVIEDETFTIEALSLEHGVDNIGYRIKEKDRIKFKQEKLDHYKLKGPIVGKLEKEGSVKINGTTIKLEDVSYVQKGDLFVYLPDTRYFERAASFAKDATILLTESTYLESERKLADTYFHMTAKDAATLAKKAQVKKLILTHFSARYREEAPFVQEAKSIFSNVEAAVDCKQFLF